jgi:hypothetical protein
VKTLLTLLLLSACIPTSGLWRWWWDRNPETDVVGYSIETFTAEAFHYSCQGCCDDSCLLLCGSTCISYTMTPSMVETVEPQPGTSPVCTDWDSGSLSGSLIPSLDSVLFVNVRAVDSAGNVGN